MDLTLDYNTELFPLVNGDSFAMALTSSLSRDGGAPTADDEDGEDKDRDVWRPDGKGRRGLEEDYDYVMYGKVQLCLPSSKGLNSPSDWFHRYINLIRHRVTCCIFTVYWLALILCSTAYASFGGLLLSITGSYRHLTSVVLSDPVCALLRK
ncbi:hypothetical protein DFH29DRAFT_906956 [Suillus ampliporus]|nr:hypothetical protein DFH29DRAFT_906956 [Suillus ampliporus]